MFSSRKQLRLKTPANGIDRKDYINLLVDEYYETTDVEAQEQVTANLANFAYDPINYEYLRDSKAVELFLQLLSSPNPKLTLHGITAVCNLCLDPENHRIIISENGIESVSSLLHHNCPSVTENAIATLLQLNAVEVCASIFSVSNRKRIVELQKSSNPVIRNWATIFLETSHNVRLQAHGCPPST